MAEHLNEVLSTRTVVISFPNGETQYWLTDQAFAAGDTLRRNGNAWVVTEIVEPARSGGYLKVLLRELTQPQPA
jgi:hypothetical protein